MTFNPDIHDRKSIRLKKYDYAKEGSYFITICTQNRENVFGEIADAKNILNRAGDIIAKWYLELENKYPTMKCGEYIIMPNHFHCIINKFDTCRGRPVCLPYTDLRESQGRHTGLPLHRIVQWFKTMTTNEYIKMVNQYRLPSFDRRLWQRNYYEHIIRDEKEYNMIAEYISNNPLLWENDLYNNTNQK